MRTLVSDPPPAEFEELLKRRRRSGADRHDEVWDGVHRMMPSPGYAHWWLDEQLAELLRPLARASDLVSGGAFNLGDKDDYRVPDRGLHRPEDRSDWQHTAAVVIEILSPGDTSWDKLPFYAVHQVDELLMVDPARRTVDWLALDQGEYRPIERSRLIDLGPTELAERINWP
ncbi:MAG: Uma2 family endonuclease [Solirubrobacteraceae bacterium]